MKKETQKNLKNQLEDSKLLNNSLEKELLGKIKGGSDTSDENTSKNANNGEGWRYSDGD